MTFSLPEVGGSSPSTSIRLITEHKIDLAIANSENSAGGFGITPSITEELLSLGLDVLTGGNHSFDKREIYDYYDRQPRLLRPANLPPGLPGSGLYTNKARNGVPYAVLNLQGRRIDGKFGLPVS